MKNLAFLDADLQLHESYKTRFLYRDSRPQFLEVKQKDSLVYTLQSGLGNTDRESFVLWILQKVAKFSPHLLERVYPFEGHPFLPMCARSSTLSDPTPHFGDILDCPQYRHTAFSCLERFILLGILPQRKS